MSETTADRDRDDLDPELIALRRPRAGIGPLLFVSVVGLSLYVLWQLSADLSFWLGPKTPRDLGAQPATLPDNAFVTVTAVPDRARAVRLRGRADVGRRVAPVIGSGGRLWLDLEGDAVLAKGAYDERYTGRLRELDDLSYADELREFVDAQPAQPRFVSLPDLAAPGQETADLGGDRFVLAPDTQVELEERVPNRARVTVVKTDTLKDEHTARLAISAALAEQAPAPVEETEGSWVYELAADPVALRARFTEARFYAGIVEPQFALHRAPLREVAVGPGGVRVGGSAEIPLSAIEHAAVYLPTRIPDGAMMLVAGETPDVYWYVPVLFGLLGVLSAVVIWAFVRTLRPEKGAGAAPSV
jgi:hypothetical protein